MNPTVRHYPEAQAYARELAAEIVANGNPHGDLATEMEAAHQRRQAFALEMAEGRTARARAFRSAMERAVSTRDPDDMARAAAFLGAAS